MFLKDTSIQSKITTVIMLTTVSALFLAVATVFAFEVHGFRLTIRREIASIAEIIGSNMTAALEFDDKAAGTRILSALEKDPRIITAGVYTPQGDLFASFQRNGEEMQAPLKLTQAPFQNKDLIMDAHSIFLNDTKVGTLVIYAIDKKINSRLFEYILILLSALIISTLGALVLSSVLRRFISEPIIHLADVARTISQSNDYTMRASKTSNDETGMLIDQFNTMLEKIGALTNELEERVVERTLELERSQEKLRHSERLASIGTLAAGIAHEIRNPLNSIQLASQYALKNQKSLDDAVKNIFNIIGSEAIRCANIIKNVMLFAKSEQTIKTPQNINEVVSHAVDLAKTYTKENFLIQLELLPEQQLVKMNPTEIEQVIMNLINNAIEASPGTAIVTIKIFIEGEKIVVTVGDKGRGIPADLINHVFDPFFSTKRKQGNTGLGLSLSHGIIHEHGGTMTLESTIGIGTTFRIEFPRAEL